MTAQQPENNAVRVAIQAFAAVCGGTQSLHTNSRDEALGLPTEESARLALRTQQIVAHESGITAVADPLGGSYVIEALTAEIVAQARAIIEKIDRMGGALAAIERGYQQAEIADSAYRYQRAVEVGEESVVGVNCFVSEDEEPTEILRIDPQAETDQVARLRALRARRDGKKQAAALAALRAGAKEGRNLVPPILESVRAEATLGEISDTLRGVFGEHREGD